MIRDEEGQSLSMIECNVEAMYAQRWKINAYFFKFFTFFFLQSEEGQSLNLTEYTDQVTCMQKRRTRAYFFKFSIFFGLVT